VAQWAAHAVHTMHAHACSLSPLSRLLTFSIFAWLRPAQRVGDVLQTIPKSREMVSQILSRVVPTWINNMESRGLCSAAMRLVHTSARCVKARGGGSSSRTKHIHWWQNRDLMAAAKSDDSEQVCTLVAKWWQDRNTMNVTMAYQKLLIMRTTWDTHQLQDAGHEPCRARDKMLAILVVLCEQHILVFGARECANTLHTLAKTRR